MRLLNKLVSLAVSIASLVFLAISLPGCGKSASGADSVVAQVGKSPITESTLRHWAATFLRGDFFSGTGHKAPAGLGTDPPNYAACVAAAKTLTPAPGKPKLNATQLNRRCHELYRSVSVEALSFLIGSLWSIGQVAELGERSPTKRFRHISPNS